MGEHDLADPANYYEFCTMIDVQSYIDYLCATIYGCNLDQNEVINRQMYRARTPIEYGESDGRWRWSLYDMDFLDGLFGALDYFEVSNAYEINSFNVVHQIMLEQLDILIKQKHQVMEETMDLDNRDQFCREKLFKALMQNAEFRDQFVASFEDMVDTDYSMDNVDRVLDKYVDDGELKASLRDFFINRPEYMKKYLYEEFYTEDTEGNEGTE